MTEKYKKWHDALLKEAVKSRILLIPAVSVATVSLKIP